MIPEKKRLFLVFAFYIKKLLPFESIQTFNNEILCITEKKFLFFIISFFKGHTNFQYKILTSVIAVDFIHKMNRFEISYDFLTLVFNSRIKIRIFLNEISFIDSICLFFNSANWWEREIFDMFGIFFSKHPDLRKLLTDYGFVGFPLRKDFPLSGFFEIRFDQFLKRIISEPIEFSKKYRFFHFENPWNIKTFSLIKKS